MNLVGTLEGQKFPKVFKIVRKNKQKVKEKLRFLRKVLEKIRFCFLV